MAKLCEDTPCIKSEIDLFTSRPRQAAMTKATWMDFHPVSTITQGAPIDFFITGATDAYLDLSQTMLVVRAKVTKGDGTNFLATDKIAPCNNFLHTMFSDVSLSFNDKQVEGSSHMYPWRSYFSTQLLYDKNVKKTQLWTQGFALDEASKMEDIASTGFVKRAAIISGSRVFELAGPLNLDFFQQSKDLLNLVNVRIKLTPAQADFALFATDAATQAKITIQSAVLYVRRVGIKPDVLMDHEALLKREVASYAQQHSEMITYTIPAGSLSHMRDNLFRGLMPKFMMMAMSTNSAYNGRINTNPFNFQHFDVNYIGLFREGECVTGQPLQPDFGTTKLCMRDYLFFYQNIEQYALNESCSITFDEWINGTTLFAFNLTPDLEMAGHSQEDKEGNLRLELRFNTALKASINVIIMAVFDGRIVFDQMRIPSTDFNV